MQKKVLLSSILVIALCLSAIAGSTYALFTDKAETSIAITSGNVEVDANMIIDSLYSAVASDAYVSDYLVDEYGQNYAHAPQTGKFSNGGSAVVNSEGQIEVTHITPGDKFNAKIAIKNVGNVDMIYRFKISSNDKLAEVMVVKVLDANGNLIDTVSSPEKFVELYTSKWTLDVIEEGEDATVYLSFELPVYVGSAYERLDLTYDIVVEAVQGNANTNGIDVVPAN